MTAGNGKTVTSSNAKIIVQTAAPTITTQPKNYTGVVGDTATFTVTATGTGLTYQWQYKDPDGSWTNSKSTTNTATCAITAARDGRLYRCKVSAGGVSVTSGSAKVIVKPAITTQPKNYTGAVGDTATFTVKATGPSLTYKWQYSDNNGSSWTDSTANTTATATCKITAARDGRLYRCIVTAGNGKTVTSSSAKLIVK